MKTREQYLQMIADCESVGRFKNLPVIPGQMYAEFARDMVELLDRIEALS